MLAELNYKCVEKSLECYQDKLDQNEKVKTRIKNK